MAWDPARAPALAVALLVIAGGAFACGVSESPGGDAPPSASETSGRAEPVPPVGAGASPETSGGTRAADAAPAADPAADVDPAAEGLDGDLLSPSVTTEPQTRIVPLDSLLRAPTAPKPAPAPRVLDLREPSESDAKSADKEGTSVTDTVRDRVRVERRSERIGRVGPDQGTYSETEAGVDVPVGEGVKLRGGVRVQERDDPAEERRERESTPQVGVEIEF